MPILIFYCLRLASKKFKFFLGAAQLRRASIMKKGKEK
jgi:hypothetical protein